jgi:hypothetical protein
VGKAMTTFASHTPPKYIAMLKDRTAKVLLEQRLAHFIDWLHEKGIRLEDAVADELITVSGATELINEYIEG